MRIIFIILSFFIFCECKSQSGVMPGVLFVSGTASTLLLDSLSSGTAQTAYSFRKLKGAYAGYCIRIKRSSDNTTQDIGFVSNFLDTATMKTFVGANNGTLTIWYDQTGNSRDMTPISTEPTLVSAGVLQYETGRLGLRMNLAPLTTANYQAYPDSATFNFVMKVATNVTYNTPITKTSGAIPAPLDFYNNNVSVGNGTNGNNCIPSTSFNSSSALSTWTYRGYNRSTTTYIEVNRNGSQIGIGSISPTRYADNSNKLRIGTRGDAFTTLNGWCMEVITFSAINTTDQGQLTSSQTWFYGL